MNEQETKKLKMLQDDILDAYNLKKISKKEMTNSLKWINGIMKKYADDDDATITISREKFNL